MAIEYVGSAVLYVDGVEVEVTKVDVKDMTGKKPVKTMNSTGRLRGFTRGIGEYNLNISAVMPADGKSIDWANIEGAKLTLSPLTPGSPRVSYLDCVTSEAGTSYTVDNEAMIDITMFAHRKIKE